MNRLIAIVVFITSVCSIYSQNDYRPLVREGVEWECTATYLNYGESKEFDYSIKIIGDSVVDGVSYKKCYYIFADDAFNCNDHAVALLREDVVNQKVYMRLTEKAALCDPFISFSVETEQPEMLLYDFGNINNNEQYWREMDSEELQSEVIMSNGILLNNYGNYIIEGIGCIDETRDPFTIGGGEISGYPKYHLRVNRFIDENGNIMYDRSYHRLVREGVKWKCSMAVCYELNHENDLYQYTIELKGDTTINNIRYKKCYYTFVNNGIATDDIPKAFLREDIAEKKVYVLLNKDYKVNVAYTPVPYDTDSGEKLLYDFNDWTNPELCWNTSNIINSVTTEKISYNGKEYTKTILNGEYVVVDGIGFAKNEITWVGYDLLHPYVDRPSDGSSFIGSLSCLDFFIDETGTNIDMFDMLGIDELKQDDKSVLIELIKGSINISSIEEIKSVRIINMAGMVIDVVSPNVNTITIPTDKYPSGCYIIQVATENDITTKKIII